MCLFYRELDFPCFLIYVRDFDADFLSDFEDFLGITDISIDDLRDMYESVILESYIDKCTECNNITHDTIEDISDSYRFESELPGTYHCSTLSARIMTN